MENKVSRKKINPIQIIQNSLNQIFDLYRGEDRGYLNFSFLFLLLASVAAYFWSFLVLLCAGSLYRLGEFGVHYSFFELLANSLIWFKLKNCIIYFTIATLGLYATYLQEVLPIEEEKLSLRNFFEEMKEKDWIRYLIVMGALVLFYSLTFVDVFEIEQNESGEGILGLLNQFGNNYSDDRWNDFYRWFNSIVYLINDYLAYLAAAFLVVWKEYPKMDTSIFKKFVNYIWIVLIISFCLSSIFNNLIFFINQYLIELLNIPFKVELAKTVFSLLTGLLVASFFCAGLAGAILFPVMQIRQLEEPALETETEEAVRL